MRDATSTAEDLASKHSGGDFVSASIRLPQRGKQRAGAPTPPTTKKDVPRGAAASCVRVGMLLYVRAALSLAYVLAFFVAGCKTESGLVARGSSSHSSEPGLSHPPGTREEGNREGVDLPSAADASQA